VSQESGEFFSSLAERSDLTESHLRLEGFSKSHHHSLSPPVFVLVAPWSMILLLSSYSLTGDLKEITVFFYFIWDVSLKGK